jgi:acyl-CoA thioesterase-2
MSEKAFRWLVDDVLVVTPTGPMTFAGRVPPPSFDRIYGGQIAAQALLAARLTVAGGRPPNSLHTTFCRRGDPSQPIVYEVEELRESRHLSLRSVRAAQDDSTLAISVASFCASGGALEHQNIDAHAPDPEGLPTREESIEAVFGRDLPANLAQEWPIDLRYLDRSPWSPHAGPEPEVPAVAANRLWVRADGELHSEDLAVHAAVLAYASDLTMFEPVTYAHPGLWRRLTGGDGLFGASLDHAIWFHGPVRADRWLLHVHESPVARLGRGFTSGRYFTEEGTLVASVAQEILVLETAAAP